MHKTCKNSGFSHPRNSSLSRYEGSDRLLRSHAIGLSFLGAVNLECFPGLLAHSSRLDQEQLAYLYRKRKEGKSHNQQL